jgi:thiol-disulfide isomerase/thioredoxin
LHLLDGSSLSSTELAGQVVVLNFWATWCAPCRAEMPALDRYYRQHRAQGLRVIAVCIDQPADREKIAEAVKGLELPVALYGKSRLGGFEPVPPVPRTFVIDRRQRLRKAGWSVAPQLGAAQLEQVVTPLLAGANPD